MNTQDIKKEYTIFSHDPALVYLDSAASSLTPDRVVEKMRAYYTTYRANIARGLYASSIRATEEFEHARQTIASFINAQIDEIVFTSGTTMSINMVAHGLAHTLTPAHNVVTTIMEHHANFIPWQQLCIKTGAQLHIAQITQEGAIDQEHLLSLIDARTQIVALTHVSNVLGVINPLAEIIAKIRAINPHTLILVDAAQSIAHLPIDVSQLDCDFLTFSMHKLFGPTGIGVLFGKKASLEKLLPIFTGGEMIDHVSTCGTTFRELPHRLEAGTPNIAGAIASAEAIAYITEIGHDVIRVHEMELLSYCQTQMREHFGDHITIIGPSDVSLRSGLISFTFDPFHPHDIATILDDSVSVAIRAGQHCTMPLHMESLHVPATARASFSVYNTKEDVDQLIAGLHTVQKTLS